ncbi:MAG TPA: cysteine desulfurase family protein [Isosphaeraceae bacterium]|jgi:cysteine desulfurase|nr:cysteine desulfurase family protein [Isosphaeraceae bacterium]
MDSIYLDHNATTPLDPQVLEAMRPYWLAAGNPESRHAAGRAARRAWEQAKETVAQILHAEPDEVIFTSGGTEANNLAIFGLADREGRGPGHTVASPIEHPAVAGPVEWLEAMGFRVGRPEVSNEGLADADRMAAACQPETRLVTLILAHNETGAIQPVGRLARLTSVPVHSDAVQAVGRIPVDFHALGVATLAASAHKFHGPVGAGLLLVRRGVKLAPHLIGGGQQQGRRAGTPSVALAVGLATALEHWQIEAEVRMDRWTSLRARLEAGLIAALGPNRVIRNGPANLAQQLPQTLNVGFPGIDGNALLMQLDLAGVAASLGAACASGTSQPSPSFLAMRVPTDRLQSSVRFSLGAHTTEAEVDEALRRIVVVIERISHASILPTSGL